ncbi:MAG TPA: carboxypeptidase-like regulatory domain-containing protein, partial [Ignavibacteriaceae bacterium]|nr:carboxypeptidase-like regulatory domain-containing protein [Ignavibacteriaceae bacterium]
MRLIVYGYILTCLFSSKLFSQNGSITGTVKDNETGQLLSSVNVTIHSLKKGTVTDHTGEFQFNNIPKGSYEIVFSFVGYKSSKLSIKVDSNSIKHLEISLSSLPIKLGEVKVYSTKTISSLNNIPIPAEVILNDQIKSSNPVSVPDVLKNEPGLALGRDGIWGTQISVRGLSKSSIVTMVDGNRLETAS